MCGYKFFKDYVKISFDTTEGYIEISNELEITMNVTPLRELSKECLTVKLQVYVTANSI